MCEQGGSEGCDLPHSHGSVLLPSGTVRISSVSARRHRQTLGEGQYEQSITHHYKHTAIGIMWQPQRRN